MFCCHVKVYEPDIRVKVVIIWDVSRYVKPWYGV
jgi:hypothetical protein